MLARARRRDAELELEPEDERAPEPPMPLPLAAGNAAVSRAVLARKNGKKGKAETKAQNAAEEKAKQTLIDEHGFTAEQIEVAGASTANADLVASDENRIWIVEVKGDNVLWLGEENQSKTHNTPAKQIGNKLLAKKAKQIRKVTIAESFQPLLPGESREDIHLSVTHISENDALLAFNHIADAAGDPKFYATTVHEVMKYIKETVAEYKGFRDDDAQAINSNADEALGLLEDYKENQRTPAAWLYLNQEAVERIYTDFRQVTAHKQPLATLKKLDAALKVNIVLLPVTKL